MNLQVSAEQSELIALANRLGKESFAPKAAR
jgi:hypothetical protein